MGGGRKGNCYISGPGKGADIKEVRNTRLKDRELQDLMTSHLCFILVKSCKRFILSPKQSLEVLLTLVCEELSPPIPHWFLSAALWWRESRDCHYLPPFLSVYFQSPGACAPSWPECERATDPSLGEGPHSRSLTLTFSTTWQAAPSSRDIVLRKGSVAPSPE